MFFVCNVYKNLVQNEYKKVFLVKLKECGEGGEDACAPFCLCGVVAEL